MVKINSKPSLSANWRAGDPLDDARFKYASNQLRISYRDSADGTSVRRAILELMEMETQDRLANGQLVAVGLRSSPPSEGAPLAIHPDLFNSLHLQVDWERSIVESSGNIFTDVTIVRQSQTPAMGRPLLREKVRGIVRALKAGNPCFDRQPRKEQEAQVRERSRAEFPSDFPGQSHPSRSLILAVLKQEQSAE